MSSCSDSIASIRLAGTTRTDPTSHRLLQDALTLHSYRFLALVMGFRVNIDRLVAPEKQ